MNRIVRHPDDKTRPLFDFPAFSSRSNCPDRIVCLSERDFDIILSALLPVEAMQTRVYQAYLGNSQYEMVGDEDFDTFQEWISDIRTNLGGYMACNEYLERIAVALEAQLALEDSRYVNLDDVLEVLELQPSEEVRDWIEALQYFTSIFPDFDFNIPIQNLLGFDLGLMRYRGAHLQLLRDIAISNRAQAVAQGGVDFASLYDTMGETAESLIKPSGYAGWAYAIWQWVSNDQIPGWAGWVTTISAALFGSIRGATYDLVDAVENLDLQGVQDAIRESTDTTVVNCNACTTTEIYNIIEENTTNVYSTTPTDSSWPTEGTPPTSDDATWSVPASPSSHKCIGSNFLVGWLIDFFSDETFTVGADDNLITITEKLTTILNNVPAVGIPLAVISIIAGRMLAYVTGGTYNTFETITTVLEDLQDFLICVLYDSANRDDAISEFRDYLINDGRLINGDIVLIIRLLESNNVLALLYHENSEIDSTTFSQYGSTCACGNPIYTLNGFNPNQSLVSGTFQDGEATIVQSGTRNYFGTDRAGLNINTMPYGNPPVNRRVRVVSVPQNSGGSNFYVTRLDAGGQPGTSVEMTPTQILDFDYEVSDVQVTRVAASDTNQFQIEFVVDIL